MPSSVSHYCHYSLFQYIEFNYNNLEIARENRAVMIKNHFIDSTKPSTLKEIPINKSTKNFSKFTIINVNQRANTIEQRKRYRENIHHIQKKPYEKCERKEEICLSSSAGKSSSSKYLKTSSLGTVHVNRRDNIMSKKIFPKRKPLPIKILDVGKTLPLFDHNLKDNIKMKNISQIFSKNKNSNKKEPTTSINTLIFDRGNSTTKCVSSNKANKKRITHLVLEEKLLNLNSYNKNGYLSPISNKMTIHKENPGRNPHPIALPRPGPKIEKKNCLPAIKGISKGLDKDNTLSALKELSLRISRRFKNTSNTVFNINEFLPATRPVMFNNNTSKYK